MAARSALASARAGAVSAAPVDTPAAMPGDLMSRRQRLRVITMLGSFIAIAPLTIDMYLPALPAITSGLATTEPAVQLTLTGTLLGLAAGQLLVGPLSDAVGRRRPLIAGLAVHVLASILCALAPNIAWLGALRVLQGIGVAAALVVAIAVVRDLFSGLAFARVFSRLMLVMGAAPILAPALGGLVLQWTNWRGVFLTLGGFGLVLAVVASYGLRETLPPQRRRPARLGSTLRYYGVLLHDGPFVGLVAVAGLAMAALFSYVAGSSFVMQDQFGLSEQEFAVVFGAGSVALITATQLNVRLLRRWTPQQVLVAALAGAGLSGLGLVAVAAVGVGGLPALLIPLWGVLGSAGLIMPNASALAMTRHGEAAGTAGSLLGVAQFGIGAVTAPLVGLLGAGSLAMASVIAGTMVGAGVAMLFVLRQSPAASDIPAGDLVTETP